MFSAAEIVRGYLGRMEAASAGMGRDLVFMEICGTHTMSAFRSGLHSLLPENVKLLSGPGCPVCVTAQGDIDLLVSVAGMQDVTVCTYGDMVRVPGLTGSLEKARSLGADVRVIYSTMDAVEWAKKLPGRTVVLGAVGFETTAPATAAAVMAAKAQGIRNFCTLTSHKLVVPAMTALLEGGEVRVDGFICPGHVSAVIGVEAYRGIVERFRMPCVIGGFEEVHMAGALATLAEMVRDGRAELVNDYPEAVGDTGNAVAMKLLDEVFEVGDVRWRALGVIPKSGLVMREKYAEFDAMKRFGLRVMPDREIGGCICGKVITGMATPRECKLFGNGCTPVHPIGPCMVSSEGTCAAWFKYGRNGTRLKRREAVARG